ncbi:hypothetical protein EKO04_001171 [Ascochyta lentis]|uniref:Serine hydrolase domain-containing protein n=1 Tax=Ascochyta lentis TaxID=205686 RepID=A0A8H7JB68_9PLEO|nr:hypothetical protein EKO04_001171 [Ascochyta lentis]
MRILCLHGRGTNSKIFEMQTAAIRYELGDRHTFDFAEGSIYHDANSDIKDLLAADEKTFAYFSEDDPATALKAIKDLDTFVHVNGPYDGVMAFSQSVGLVGTWMVQRQKLGKPSFRFAVFLSGASPVVDFNSLQDGNVVLLPPEKFAGLIDLPTAHIWGSQDPYADVAKNFSAVCRADLRSATLHTGKHEVPGAGSKESVTAAVNIMRRAIILAQ